MTAELVERIDAAEDALAGTRALITGARDELFQVRRAGVVALELDRALVAIATTARALERAHREADRAGLGAEA